MCERISLSSLEARGYNVNVQRVEITAEVVSCLISEQFPQWAELEVRPVELDGWDNTTFRLGGDKSVGSRATRGTCHRSTRSTDGCP